MGNFIKEWFGPVIIMLWVIAFVFACFVSSLRTVYQVCEIKDTQRAHNFIQVCTNEYRWRWEPSP